MKSIFPRINLAGDGVFSLLGAEVGGEQVAGGIGAGVLDEADEIDGGAALFVELGDFFLELGGGVFELERDLLRVRFRISTFSFISRRTGLGFLANGFAFFAASAHEFLVELEVHLHAEGMLERAAARARRGLAVSRPRF